MGWLRSLFTQSEEVARLLAEREIFIDRAKELDKKLEASEARLMREIASNRKREDAYKDELVALNAPQLRLPYRDETILEEPKPHMVELFDDGGVLATKDEVFERLVTERAEEFAAQAAENGIPYDSMTFELCKDKIRQNPAEYLEN